MTVMVNGKPYSLTNADSRYSAVLQALREGDDDSTIERLLNPAVVLADFIDDDVKVYDNGRVTYKDEELAPVLQARLTDMVRTKAPVKALLAFLHLMYMNPSRRAIQELYKFLEHKQLPITEAGTFLAYKAIRNDWTDKYTGTIDNHIGRAPCMQRHDVDDDARNGCAKGMHVGSLDYVQGFASGYGSPYGDRIVIVEVNPADVVSVPFDCECQKVRVTGYKVVAEYTGPLPGIAVPSGDRPYESLAEEESEDIVDDFLDSDGDEENIEGRDVKVYTQEEFDRAVEAARELGRLER